MKTSSIATCALLLLPLIPACAESASGRASERDDRASADFCVEAGSPAAAGILALVNDPAVDVELLDLSASAGGVGLYRNAAQNIVAARPLDSLEQLDAVPYVGQSACRSLARYACNEQDRCRSPLSMVSWNIEHFPLTDQTEDAVIELVEDLQPDLVGVQEIQDREAFEDLVDRLDDYEGLIGARGYFTRVGILYRSSAVELLESEDLFVDDTYHFPRSALSADFDVLGAAESTTLSFAVVHLKAFGDSQSVARRRGAVDLLRGWVDERRDDDAGQIVIVGDWNDRLTDDEEDNVFLPLTEDDARAQFLTMEAAEAGESSYIPFPSLIDHIMVTDEIFDALDYQQTEVLYLDQTWSGTYEQTVSDHRPVQARFDLVQRFEE
ncbi:MAG: endonuclease/exonuclease/phosphatase family protein [Myxococcota bacterium]